MLIVRPLASGSFGCQLFYEKQNLWIFDPDGGRLRQSAFHTSAALILIDSESWITALITIWQQRGEGTATWQSKGECCKEQGWCTIKDREREGKEISGREGEHKISKEEGPEPGEG